MGRVLVVDDSPTNLKVVNEILEETEHKAFYATCGQSALKVADEQELDLILLDVMMPDMDGYEVCKKLKDNSHTSAVPVIFMTALTDETSILKGFELGGVDYVTKPFNEKELLARVSAHISVSTMRKELLEKNGQLEEALVFKNHVISMSSHELRRPMTMISMLAQMAERSSDKCGQKKVAKECHDIRQLIRNATTMLDEFILIARSDLKQIIFTPTLIDIEGLCKQIIEESQLLVESPPQIMWKSTSSVETMSADKKLLHHILSNLLSNAVKYSPDAKPIEFSFDSDETMAIFTVTDHGIGIPKQNHATLFDEFTRADNTAGIDGCGLGLSIVKQFVMMHHGTIDFESEEEVGSTFIVKIPLTGLT